MRRTSRSVKSSWIVGTRKGAVHAAAVLPPKYFVALAGICQMRPVTESWTPPATVVKRPSGASARNSVGPATNRTAATVTTTSP